MVGVKIMLMLPSRSREFFFQDDKVAYARQAIKECAYIHCPSLLSDEQGVNAAEWAFDLTNNPSKQEQRELTYGRGRSVSSGDIVEVDDGKEKVQYLCLSIGWQRL